MSTLAVRAAACCLAALLALAGCQPVDDLDDLSAPEEGEPPTGDEPPGEPVGAAPATLAEALDSGEAAAARWQDGARLAEVVVELDDEQQLSGGRLTYLAPDADRLLAVEFGPDGLREERTTLDTFALSPITPAGIDALPSLPADVVEPGALATRAQEQFGACEAEGAPSDVLYATGAPLAWDPDAQEWAAPLAWTVTVTSEGGAGVVLDPVTTERRGCVAAPA